MGVGSGGPLVFQNVTDKAEGGLMVLFFGLVFPLPLPLWIFFADALG